MIQTIRLSRLALGQRAVIVHLAQDAPLQNRLRALGLTEGSAITALFRSPFGDPTAYLVKDSTIALRQSDCQGIWVKVTGESHG